jgi:hypothetical protein
MNKNLYNSIINFISDLSTKKVFIMYFKLILYKFINILLKTFSVDNIYKK